MQLINGVAYSFGLSLHKNLRQKISSFFLKAAASLFSVCLRKAAFIVIPLFFSIHSYAEKVFEFTPVCQQAYQQIISLKLNAGQQLINEARRENPENLIPELLGSYIDFFSLFFNEDLAEYKQKKPNFETRINRVSEGPRSSPFYNYCRTVLYMQKACVEIKFGERWSAGWDFRKSFSLIKENRKKFPSFVPNNMIYGPIEVIAGTIPDGYKWMASLFGIRGSIKEGMQLMRNFVNSNDPLAKLFFNEASFYYCYILFYVQNQPDTVFEYIQQKKLDVVNNHLLAYMATNLGINNKLSAYAKSIIYKKNPSNEYLSTPVWDFEMGYIKLHHLETEEAAKYFESFLNNFKGRFYVKDAYEKLSWCYYLQGNYKAAQNARQTLLKKGATDTDADKQAHKDARAGTWPNPLLLKARLLNDGGYNNDALLLLAGKSNADFNDESEKLEFTYRLARIYDDLNRDDDAIKTYLVAIKIGERRQEYYASRAALQIGYIYEKQGKKNLAMNYYQMCLNMKNHDYKDSIDQKAKAGIGRCRGQ